MEADVQHQAPPELVTQRETLKLTHNSRGYGWEIKIFSPEDKTDEDWIDRIVNINTKLMEQFGSLEV